MKSYKRADRVKQLLHQEISRLLQTEMKDPRVQFVTVTNLSLSVDLQEAKVYVSCLDSGRSREDMLAGLQRASGYLRGELGRRLKLKYIPRLEFVFDDSLDKQERILNLLDQIHEEDGCEDTSDPV
ncbi:ribosome-binding factor A [candidate division KSB3 bacterium]|uniref:Ribosome-binding factor A n=1 Tax=candidate division KSB3 bacterium TaxID=2044937 RepID=A0A2G6E1K8_9BACT|nr:MAG: ribosome-binding factor A [candidate division KSB3 bacterium]PIE28576.1 MAG: ribosome-binding factor A [candidate division KSB3 bacterium]